MFILDIVLNPEKHSHLTGGVVVRLMWYRVGSHAIQVDLGLLPTEACASMAKMLPQTRGTLN